MTARPNLYRADPDDVWHERRGDSQGLRCLMLWAAVLEQAVLDARATIVASNPGTASKNQRDARTFITRPSRHRDGILILLGLDPSWWQERVAPELQSQWAILDATTPAPPYVRPSRRKRQPADEAMAA